jgi:hypothetical protein
MKVIATTLTGLALGATGILGVASAAGSSLPRTATVQIHHQTAGCHSWSVNGGPFKAAQSLKLVRGAQLTITDNDVMSHQLVRLSGPRVTYALTKPGMQMAGGLEAPYASGMMPHMGATLRVTFATKGVYTFKTTAGEDYMKGIKTMGEDNILTLTVTVR